jgi:eukaryotic-like serine/threonine-protein kinase
LTLLPGAQLGPYRIESAIGAGGMGVVWKARDTRLDRIVAIKTVNGPFSERFEREARAISALNHPHICALYDVGEHEGAGYLVLEYVEGAPIKGPLPFDQALKYAAQICDALDAAHRKGIVHRDLKPDNILLTKSGVKLLDFGLAKAVGPAEAGLHASPDMTATKALTGAHVILGTPQYMAPEQIEGRDADARTDLFAFGCVFYELLTGQKAFEGKTPSSTMAAILATEPRPIRELQPVTPPALERIVKRCLAKDPDDRWQTARDLKAELDWIGGGGMASESVAATYTATTRVPWIVAGACAVVATAAVWAAVRRSPAVAHPITFAVYPPRNEVFIGKPSVSPDGRLLALRVRDGRGIITLVLRRLDSLDTTRLPGTEGAAYPAWSPDGQHLAFVVGDKVKRMAIGGGTPQTVSDFPSGNIPFVAWSADTIVFSGLQGLRRVPAAGGVSSPLTALDASRQDTLHGIPQFLPDGHHFLFWSSSAQAGATRLLAGSLDAPPEQHGTLVRSGTDNAQFAPGSEGQGYLLFGRDGGLMAQAFDPDALRLTGEPVRIAEKIGPANPVPVAASKTGVLVYAPSASAVGSIVSSQFAWFDRSGKQIGTVGPTGAYGDFALSPDSTRLAVTRDEGNNTDVWMMDLAHDALFSRFTFNAAVDRGPIWSPDGSRLIFNRQDPGSNLLYEKVAGGTGREERVAVGAGRIADWSRDGRLMLQESNGDVTVLVDGKPVPFLNTQFRERLSQFSPDSKWIAYVSDEGKTDQVYVQSYPGSGGKWQISTAGGTQPRWRRDGKELFYLAPDLTLMAVPISAANGFEYGVAKPLFHTQTIVGSTQTFTYAVSADGERFLVQTPGRAADGSEQPLTVVLNWFAGIGK